MFLLSLNIEQQSQSMTSFEILTLIVSTFAFIISLSAFIGSIIKFKKEKRNYKINYIIENLTMVSKQIDYYYNEIVKLKIEMKILIYNKELCDKDTDFQTDIYNLFTEFTLLHNNFLLWLSHYKPTQNTAIAIKNINKLHDYVIKVTKLATLYKNDKLKFLTEFDKIKKTKNLSSIAINDKISLITEINTTISKLLKGKLSTEEIDSQLYELDWAEEFKRVNSTISQNKTN